MISSADWSTGHKDRAGNSATQPLTAEKFYCIGHGGRGTGGITLDLNEQVMLGAPLQLNINGRVVMAASYI
jgi:hypothetical protein